MVYEEMKVRVVEVFLIIAYAPQVGLEESQ